MIDAAVGGDTGTTETVTKDSHRKKRQTLIIIEKVCVCVCVCVWLRKARYIINIVLKALFDLDLENWRTNGLCRAQWLHLLQLLL